VKINVPSAVGTPLSNPVRAPPTIVNEIPGGRFPPVTVQLVYGVTPPVAARACEYGAPIVPAGSGDVVLINKLPAGLIANSSGFDAAPPGLATVTVALPMVAITAVDTEAVNWFPFT
jgi:hypothetical protein